MDENLRQRAVTLRRAGLSRRQIRDQLQISDNRKLTELLADEPPPEWTKHPNAKDDLREKARQLRKAGRTYDEIATELVVSKSSVSLWVRYLPKPTPSPERMSRMSEKRWVPYRQAQAQARKETKQTAANEIGELTDRELFLIGVGLYWSEGSKSKPYATREKVTFVNSDPDMIRFYLARLQLLGVTSERLRLHVHIHESADVSAAEHYWTEVTGADPAQFWKTVLKKHNLRTIRKNVNSDYHGCLAVTVLDGADLYRRIEGWWAGLTGAARARFRPITQVGSAVSVRRGVTGNPQDFGSL